MSAIGLAAGCGFWQAALAGTVLVLLWLTIFKFVDAHLP
ncbi:MAG: MgtC/SapB family protein, partial [Candidatus Omnitrophica bacterium]|nr:MgtC/SapB family protein [Candidatus Omnitrophota bacterium]